MKWKTHLFIANWVGDSLGFEDSDLVELTEGSIAPDRWRDHSLHHNPGYLNKKIRERILKARRLFLQGKKNRFFELGVALHYIEDGLICRGGVTPPLPVHLQIEEELAKLSVPKKKRPSRKHSDEIRKMIIGLGIGEKEETLLLDPRLAKGKEEVFISALIDLPPVDYELLFNIACRIAIATAAGITSTDSPPELLCERVNYFTKLLNSARKRFKTNLILGLSLPLVFLCYGRYGFLIYIAIGIINISVIIPVLRNREKLKNYIRLTEVSRTLFITFILLSLSSLFTPYFLPAGIFLLVLAVFYLSYPRIPIDAETRKEFDWYNWNNGVME